jgi:hypothetical protein
MSEFSFHREDKAGDPTLLKAVASNASRRLDLPQTQPGIGTMRRKFIYGGTVQRAQGL